MSIVSLSLYKNHFFFFDASIAYVNFYLIVFDIACNVLNPSSNTSFVSLVNVCNLIFIRLYEG